MSPVQATAPGKIILFGEHAVVYSRPAIAAPVGNVSAKATLQPLESGHPFRVVASDLGQDYTLSEAAPDNPLAYTVHSALAYFGYTAPPAATLQVTSTIPLGRGLGSGAAISTAIVRVLGQFLDRSLSAAEISALVYEVEKLYHGTPSGIDNTVIAFNQPVYFIKKQPIQRMMVRQPLTLVIADTGIVAPTHQVVGDLRQRWQANPTRYEQYFDEIQDIVEQARHIIEGGGDEGGIILGQLMNHNQQILEEMGISSPELAQLVTAARRAGALGAKLSGAGWGGNMIALTTPDEAQNIAAALQAAGSKGIIVTKVKAADQD